MALSVYVRRAFVVGAAAFVALGMCASQMNAQPTSGRSISDRYALALRSFNPGLSAPSAKDMAQHVLLLASYYDLDPRLLVAIIGVESSWRQGAVSPVGAQGLGQLMPGTADGLSVQAFETYENLDGTARYLRRLLRHFWRLKPSVRYKLAIAGYNAGPEAVRRFGGIPPYAETRAYVSRVTDLWHRLQGILPGRGPRVTVIAHATRVVHRVRRAGSVADFVRLDTRMLQETAIAAVTIDPVPYTRRSKQ